MQITVRLMPGFWHLPLGRRKKYMMTQGVMTQAVNLFGNATGSVTSKGKQTGNSFELLFHSGMKSESSDTGGPGNLEVKKTSEKIPEKNNNKLSDAAEENTGQVDKTAKNNAGAEDTKAVAKEQGKAQNTEEKPTEKAENTENTDKVTEPEVDEKTMEKIAGMLQAIQQTVMEVLNLSAEEFTQLMTEQGFSVEDLLQPDNLQQLILSDKGQTNILDVLTDENLANTMKQLIQTVEEIKSKTELTVPMDQVKAILNSVKKA
jgi:hypothetical protein